MSIKFLYKIFYILSIICLCCTIFITYGCVKTKNNRINNTYKEPNIQYPRLAAYKVQPPDNGCYFGYFPLMEIEDNPKLFKKVPAILIPHFYISRDRKIAIENIKRISAFNAIPFVWFDIEPFTKKVGFAQLTTDVEFREFLIAFAADLTKRQTGIFLLPLWEINATWNIRPWHLQAPSKQIELWKYIWEIFESTGANDYVTWVWEIIPPELWKSGDIRDPEPLYPGDKYVDWIALSVISRSSPMRMNDKFVNLISPTYQNLRKNHPNKPIMISEFSRTNDAFQSKWFETGFQDLKSLGGIKAVCVLEWVEDRTNVKFLLSDDTVKIINSIHADPYFIWAK